MRQEEDRRDSVAAFEEEERRRARLESLQEPKPEGITPEQMELIKDARTSVYWLYQIKPTTKSVKELEVDLLSCELASALLNWPFACYAFLFNF